MEEDVVNKDPKICTKCGESLNADMFPPRRRVCKLCYKAQRKKLNQRKSLNKFLLVGRFGEDVSAEDIAAKKAANLEKRREDYARKKRNLEEQAILLQKQTCSHGKLGNDRNTCVECNLNKVLDRHNVVNTLDTSPCWAHAEVYSQCQKCKNLVKSLSAQIVP